MESYPEPDAGTVRLLESVAGALRAGKSAALPEGVLAKRVGRNEVWRLTLAAGDRYYAKVWRDTAEYERERRGLERAETIARHDQRFSFARTVVSDTAAGVIVTTEIPGVPIGVLIRDAYRRDRNPVAVRGRKRLAHRAVAAAVGWLEAFHGLAPPPGEFLFDHSLEGIVRRIAPGIRKLSRCAEFEPEALLLTMKSKQRTVTSERLLLGDASLGNFLFDGERLGVVDFEDIGIGPAVRDFVVFRYWLQRTLGSALYSSDEELLRLIPFLDEGSDGRAEVRAILESELCIQQLEMLDFRQSWVRRRERKRLHAQLMALLACALPTIAVQGPGRA